jgi:hypothetical protein
MLLKSFSKNVEYLIDVGCGKGKKLNQLQEQTGIKTIGIDYGANIHECVTNFPDKIWIEKNIESEELFDLDLNYKNCGIIFSDVIEHLLEPEIVLFQFKKIIEKAQFIIISTPERDRERGGNDFGPPKNETHVREWSINELRDLYKLFNLPIILHGLTRNNDVENRLTTIITVFSKTINLGIDPQYKHALYFDESNKPCYTYID